MTTKNSDFKNILVCIDGSKHSELALSKAIRIAEKYKSKLILLIVIDEYLIDFWNEMTFYAGNKKPPIHLTVNSKAHKNAQKILEKFVKKIPPKIEFNEKILVGDVANEIIHFTKKYKVDLVVLGARGKGTFTKLLLGSVSSKVSSHSPCSVMIIR